MELVNLLLPFVNEELTPCFSVVLIFIGNPWVKTSCHILKRIRTCWVLDREEMLRYSLINVTSNGTLNITSNVTNIAISWSSFVDEQHLRMTLNMHIGVQSNSTRCYVTSMSMSADSWRMASPWLSIKQTFQVREFISKSPKVQNLLGFGDPHW